jgi:hypothetical protein
MMSKTLERFREWISNYPGTLGFTLSLFFVFVLFKLGLSSLNYDYQVTNESVRQWVSEHQGTLLGCKSTNKLYYCRVQTSSGVVKLVYEQIGSREPCMVFYEYQ